MSHLHLALLWHHHQPYYKDLYSGRYSMPWVRLHGIKDYYGMARLLEQAAEADAPVHATINLVPSLLAQLEEYAAGRAIDPHLELSARHAADLDAEERERALDLLFMANWDNIIRVHPRYGELLAKRRPGKLAAKHLVREFSVADIRDLQVWSNLAWFHRTLIDQDEGLRALIQKDRNFSEQDKRYVLERQREVLGEVIPLHRRLQESGIIELTTTPFYHPILPLLCDMGSALEALPGTRLPAHRLALGDDARVQLERAVRQYERLFGARPRGLWPSEGGVSPDILPLVAEQGFEYLAGDEQVLGVSLGVAFHRGADGRVENGEALYQPYRLETSAGDLAMVFRDHRLSDRIGFDYQGMPGPRAAEHLIERLRAIRRQVHHDPLLVSIILDGENPWEYYADGGIPFLRTLYRELARADDLRTVRLGDYLAANPPQRTLERLHSGSWINHNFHIWIGHQDDVRAWEYVFRVRADLVRFSREESATATESAAEALEKAWESIYIAEGSDWYWWYGDDHSSALDEAFDQLFRRHLQNVYRFLDKPVPPFLEVSVLTSRRPPGVSQPNAFLEVTLDGRATTYFEWLAAGRYRISTNESQGTGGGTMSRAGGPLVEEIRFGFDLETLFVRVDLNEGWHEQLAASPETTDEWRLRVAITDPQPQVLEVRDLLSDTPSLWRLPDGASESTEPRLVDELAGQARQSRLPAQDAPVPDSPSASGRRRRTERIVRQKAQQAKAQAASKTEPCWVAVDQLVEIACPFAVLGLGPGDEAAFHVELVRGDATVERLPGLEPVRFTVPSEEFEAELWQV